MFTLYDICIRYDNIHTTATLYTFIFNNRPVNRNNKKK